MQSMLTSLKMEAIEECDSDDASVVDRARSVEVEAMVGGVGLSRSSHSGSGVGRRKTSSSSSSSSSSNPAVTKKRSEATSTSRSRQGENVPTLATSDAITREKSVDAPLPNAKIPGTTEDDDADSETPTEKTTDDESSNETKSLRAFDMDDDSCDGGIFDYDDDVSMLEAAKDEEEEDELTWRLDPEQSLSDWTVILTNKITGEVKPYHLHKNILAVGPRKCDFFVGVFRKTKTQEIASNKTEMTMEGPAFDCFPHFLDFVYSTGALELTTETATPLRHLAKCFGLKIMFKQATEFLLKDISLSNIITYYKHSVILVDEKITAMAAKHITKNIMKVEPAGELIKTMDSDFFLRVVTAPEIELRKEQYHMSFLVAEFCKINKERIDTDVFVKLTDEKILPVVDHSVALSLLEMEADIVVVTTSVLEFSNITSLQKRCIKDLSYHWKEFSELEKEQVGRVCRKLPSGVVTELLMKSLSQAKRKAESAPKLSLKNVVDEVTDKSKKDSDSSSVGSAQEGPSKQEAQKASQAKKEYEAKVVDVKREHQEEMAHLKKEYETNLLKLRDLCMEKDRHMASYWQELQRYVRLPNAPEGKFVPSGTVNKATKMPEIAKVNTDGHLFSTRKDGESRRYPMFYYQAD
jgi:hypothetical protein